MSDIIAGRIEEKIELLDAFNSEKAEFITLYGRRRIGKTFLIEELFNAKNCYFFHVTGVQNGKLLEQLSEFAKVIGNTFYKGASIASPISWMMAFEELSKAIANAPQNKKIVLFFDELPWMCTKKSRLLQALDYYWNRHWKNDKRIKLIICGSSASWMIKKIIHNKGGLHNRSTRIILLRPFTLSETKQFFNHSGIKLTHKQIVQFYMFCGGIPFYLAHVKRGKSAAQMIDKMCFQENGILYAEFDKIFDSLFNEANVYKELIRVIARKKMGVGRPYIEKNSKYLSDGGTLTEKLKDLESAGFIKTFKPLGHKRQGVYYRVIDEYCYFYLKWIEPTKHTLIAQERNNQYWSNKVNTPEYYNWMGYAFESICYKHISEIKKALEINAGSHSGTWRYLPKSASKEIGAQIDLLFERKDGVTTICEIKYTEDAYVIDKDYAENLKRKINIYQEQTRTKNQIHLAFISAAGIKENEYSRKLVDGVVVLDDLF